MRPGSSRSAPVTRAGQGGARSRCRGPIWEAGRRPPVGSAGSSGRRPRDAALVRPSRRRSARDRGAAVGTGRRSAGNNESTPAAASAAPPGGVWPPSRCRRACTRKRRQRFSASTSWMRLWRRGTARTAASPAATSAGAASTPGRRRSRAGSDPRGRQRDRSRVLAQLVNDQRVQPREALAQIVRDVDGA